MVIFSCIGLFIILIILWDAFETVVLPRRVTRRFRLARIYYRNIWLLWRKKARKMPEGSKKETYLAYFGPLSLLLLLALWALGLIIGFALLNFGLGIPLTHLAGKWDFLEYLFASGATFLPLDFGDIAALEPIGRTSFLLEAAMGFGFLALIIGYFPVLYEAFSNREIHINMLDPRAGSPPSALHLIKSYAGDDVKQSFNTLLENWEIWCAELLESHLSYPVLAYYRSQHDNQSWLSALLAMLDVSALVIVGLDDIPHNQAKFTFAMARHAAVDLSQVFHQKPHAKHLIRLSHEDFKKLSVILEEHGIPLTAGKDAEEKLAELRASYEPSIQILSEYFQMPIQPFLSERKTIQEK